MTTLEILRDNREQLPWEFEHQDVTVADVTLSTGDYTLAEFCDHDEGNDTYYPNYAVERKSGDDFVNSITRDRERFKAEIKRAADWSCPLLVIIEEPKHAARYQDNHYLEYYEVTESQVFGTVEEWERYYNVRFDFAGSRVSAQQTAYSMLATRLRSVLFD